MTLRDRERNLQQRQDFKELMKYYPFTTETLPGEEWRDIEGYDGKYQISNYSRVKSLRREKVRILTPRLTNKGYLVCRLKIQGKEVCVIIHRLVAKTFIENPNNLPHFLHFKFMAILQQGILRI